MKDHVHAPPALKFRHTRPSVLRRLRRWRLRRKFSLLPALGGTATPRRLELLDELVDLRMVDPERAYRWYCVGHIGNHAWEVMKRLDQERPPLAELGTTVTVSIPRSPAIAGIQTLAIVAGFVAIASIPLEITQPRLAKWLSSHQWTTAMAASAVFVILTYTIVERTVERVAERRWLAVSFEPLSLYLKQLDNLVPVIGRCFETAWAATCMKSAGPDDTAALHAPRTAKRAARALSDVLDQHDTMAALVTRAPTMAILGAPLFAIERWLRVINDRFLEWADGEGGPDASGFDLRAHPLTRSVDLADWAFPEYVDDEIDPWVALLTAKHQAIVCAHAIFGPTNLDAFDRPEKVEFLTFVLDGSVWREKPLVEDDERGVLSEHLRTLAAEGAEYRPLVPRWDKRYIEEDEREPEPLPALFQEHGSRSLSQEHRPEHPVHTESPDLPAESGAWRDWGPTEIDEARAWIEDVLPRDFGEESAHQGGTHPGVKESAAGGEQ
jgi:hypothetical protein